MDILSAVPNILLILTVSIGFMQGSGEGIVTGFLAGLLIDLFYGDIEDAVGDRLLHDLVIAVRNKTAQHI